MDRISHNNTKINKSSYFVSDLSGETGILKKPPEKDFMIDSSHFQLVTDRLMNGNVYTIESVI